MYASKSARILFRRHRGKSWDKNKGNIFVEHQSIEAASREGVDGAEQGDMGSFPVLATIPYLMGQ